MQEGILNVKEQESFALYFTYNLLKKHEFQPLGKHVRSYFVPRSRPDKHCKSFLGLDKLRDAKVQQKGDLLQRYRNF